MLALEKLVFLVAVDESGEDVMPDEICRHATENSKRGGVVAEVCSSQTRL